MRTYTINGLLHQWSRKNPRTRSTKGTPACVKIHWPDGTVVEGHPDFSYVPGRGSLIRLQVTHPTTRVLLRQRIVEARGYR